MDDRHSVGGPLELIAPDKAERVTCPNCDSLLDVNQGNLTYLKALNPRPDQPDFVLEIGSKGVLNGTEFQILNTIVRNVVFDGVKYF